MSSNMSSNVPTNEQNAAGGAGSDTDSISSLSSQAANMNLDRSSSPAPLLSSSVASDEEGDITIVKETSLSEVQDPAEDGQMPFLDKYGAVSLPVSSVLLPYYLETPATKYTTPVCLVCLNSSNSPLLCFGHVSHHRVFALFV